MTRLGEAFSYGDLEYQILDFSGIKIRIATPKTLFLMKKDTVRPQDKMDAMFLHDLIEKRK